MTRQIGAVRGGIRLGVFSALLSGVAMGLAGCFQLPPAPQPGPTPSSAAPTAPEPTVPATPSASPQSGAPVQGGVYGDWPSDVPFPPGQIIDTDQLEQLTDQPLVTAGVVVLTDEAGKQQYIDELLAAGFTDMSDFTSNFMRPNAYYRAPHGVGWIEWQEGGQIILGVGVGSF